MGNMFVVNDQVMLLPYTYSSQVSPMVGAHDFRSISSQEFEESQSSLHRRMAPDLAERNPGFSPFNQVLEQSRQVITGGVHQRNALQQTNKKGRSKNKVILPKIMFFE